LAERSELPVSNAQDCLRDIRKRLDQGHDDEKVVRTLREGLALVQTSLLIGPGGYILTRQKNVVLVRFVNADLLKKVRRLLDQQPDLFYEQIQNVVLWVAYKNKLPSAAERKQLEK